MVTKENSRIGGRWRIKLEVLDSHMHTTIYKIEGHQDLLYNTGNLQYLTITYNGKESEQEKYIYRTKSLWCTPETNIL